MPIGPLIRRSFGRHEKLIAETYRRIFVDLDDLSRLLLRWCPDPKQILEVGCGEGAMTERLAASYPNTRIVATDICERIGRLYSGPAERVTFRREFVEQLAEEQPGQYDLVILADVIHHVPKHARISLLRSIRRTMSPHAKFVFKDWLRSGSLIHLLAYSSDRYLTGDDISYLSFTEFTALAESVFGTRTAISYVLPWRSNVAMLFSLNTP